MEHTLEVSDRIYVNRLTFVGGDPDRGDIVVFNESNSWGQTPHRSGVRWIAGATGDLLGFGSSNHHALVKRVIGVPNDTVRCCDANGAVEVNGDALDEPYIYEDFPFEPGTLDCKSIPMSWRCFGPVKVGRDQFLMLGDHRANSNDSVTTCRQFEGSMSFSENSCAKFAMRDDIVGEVFARVWPLSSIGAV